MPMYVHVCEDPDKAWSVLAPSYLHELNYYGALAAQDPKAKISFSAVHEAMTDLNIARNSPAYAVVTPEQCIALAKSLPDESYICLRINKPGIHTDMSWESLELFANKVMPHIDVITPEALATPVVDVLPWVGRG
jgi:hypothetical protein